ncbi:hypothetical protein [Sphingomonas sp. BK345]|uniref:hypothetical protein n=1 Tax=Sphingomonas sp. BK345 TaxID=2586980 RepID=UPI001853861D|nr:hypothetical protein [Sphingomonas sp. BK345]MBB3475320.1 hypothetical protein [Sphingomonas sp. BK345]
MLLVTLVLVVAALTRWRLIDWPGLFWLASFAAMTAIRLPYHARNRGNAVMAGQRGTAERIVMVGMFATMMVLPLVHLATGVFAGADYTLPEWMSAAGRSRSLRRLCCSTAATPISAATGAPRSSCNVILRS